VDSRDFC